METRVARCYSPSYCSQFQLRRELKWKKETADQRLQLDREGVFLLDATEVGLKNIILCCGLTSIILLWFLPSAKIAIFIWELQLLFRSVWRKITEFWRRNLQKEIFLWVVCQDRSRTSIKYIKKPRPKKTCKDEGSSHESNKKKLTAIDKGPLLDQPVSSELKGCKGVKYSHQWLWLCE